MSDNGAPERIAAALELIASIMQAERKAPLVTPALEDERSRREREVCESLRNNGLSEPLAQRLAMAGDNEQNLNLSVDIRAQALKVLGAGLEAARASVGIKQGKCPTGAELRALVLGHFPATSSTVTETEKDLWS